MTRLRNVHAEELIPTLYEASGLTADEVSMRMGKVKSYVRSYLNGNRVPRVATAAQIARAMGYRMVLADLEGRTVRDVMMVSGRDDVRAVRRREGRRPRKVGAVAAVAEMLEHSRCGLSSVEASRFVGRRGGYLNATISYGRVMHLPDFVMVAYVLGYHVLLLEPSGRAAFRVVPSTVNERLGSHDPAGLGADVAGTENGVPCRVPDGLAGGSTSDYVPGPPMGRLDEVRRCSHML